MDSKMIRISIENLYKSFELVQVLHGIDIEINDGEFVVLVGPSGCGKSTLLRTIAGLEQASKGTISIGGVVVNNIPAKDRNVAMVFQAYALYPHMTVEQNIGFPLKMNGIAKEVIKKKVREVSNILELSELLGRRPKQLSGGQKQRVAMGRAIIRDPAVFLFDEPLSNLDAKLRVQMRFELIELHKRLGATSLYVTHDQVEAMTMADKVVVMRDGNVDQIGSPLELYDKPCNRFVAEFIGSPGMNFFDGKVVENGGTKFITSEGSCVELKSKPAEGNGVKRILGIRPEHFDIVPAETVGALTVEVVSIQTTGSETLLFARHDGNEVVASFRERLELRSGEKINLKPRKPNVHIFEAESQTGRRLL